MEIILNGERELIEKEYSVTELVQELQMKPDIVTVSVNGDILNRDDFDKTMVKDGDAVDILLFMGGGE